MNNDVIYPTMVIRSQVEVIEMQEKEIEKLQKENKHLKSELECYENGLYFSSEVDKLQEKINKAIDVLLNYDETFDSKIHQEMQKELLNILQEVK